MRLSRTLLCTLGVVFCGSAVGYQTAAAVTASPTVNIHRISALNDAVWPGDFNDDGILDLVASAARVSGPPRIVVSLGKGNGTFGPATVTNFAGRVLNVWDVNQDGELDVVVEDDFSNDVDVFVMLGNGDGTFTRTQRVNSFDFPRFALVADFNDDGFMDIVVGDDSGAVQVYPGRADGTYPDIVTLTAGAGARNGALGDFNGDGKIDIVVANHDAHSLTVFLNRGGLQFTPKDIPLDRQANDVAVMDVDRDGRADLLVAASHDGADDLFYIDGFVYVLSGDGSGGFGAPAKYETDRGAFEIAVGDFNRDGIPDVATANHAAKQGEDSCGFLWDTVSILPGNADGTFGAASTFSLGDQSNLGDPRFRDSVRSLAAADVDGDRQPDLIASWGAILLNRPPDANWAPSVRINPVPASVPGNESIALQAVASDVDQDALSYRWSDNGGQQIESTATPCFFSPGAAGRHTFTVVVDDHHGHTASSSVTVDFTGPPGPPPSVDAAIPAAGTIITEGQAFVIIWNVTGGAPLSSISVSVSSDDGAHFQPILECTSLPGSARFCTWNGATPVTTLGRIRVTATDSAGQTGSGVSGRFTIRAAPPIPPMIGDWSHADVGAVGAAGSASLDGVVRDGEAFTVSGSGTDIWNVSDQFHFVWKSVLGDFTIDARVDSLQNTNAWAKAGIMVRANATDAPSADAAIFVSAANGVVYQRRQSRGAFSSSTHGPAIAAPVWLRITRQALVITALYRKNLTDAWTVLGREEIGGFPGAVDVGLAVTSHANGTLATAKFSGVFVQRLPHLGTTAFGGATGSLTDAGDGTTYTLKASGTDIWSTSDSFVFFGTAINVNAQITMRVRSLAATNQWAKAGVMIRETATAGSRHANALVSAAKGIALQFRSEPNGLTESTGPTAGAAPVWLKIRRTDSATPGGATTFYAFYSTDRVTWRPLPGAAFPMSHDALIGIALTSHSPGVETTAVVDDIRIQP
jgi:regulation of enolase protein 1 (concanavalin A-like superfamily)